MKKMISMMLMLCAIVTFSACSSDDGPTNPVTNANVPSSAKIGSEVTVQGNGFAADQTLWLQPEAGEAINTNARMSANGATFTIPYTMTTGKVNVVLKTADENWILGSMTLLEADNPITTPALPAEVAVGQEVTISGIGFAEGDMVSLSAVTKADASAIPATVTADGLKFALPVEVAEGEYEVSLLRGKYSWGLGSFVVYQPRQIESITISDNAMLAMYAPMLGLKEGVLTINFAYNEDGSLKGISSNGGIEWDFAYEGKTVTTTCVFSGAPVVYTLDDQGRVVGSNGYGMYGDEETYKWSYDADGCLAGIKKDGAEGDDANLMLTTYTDGNLSAYTMGLPNELTTDNSVRACPYTVEPAYLLNSFAWMMTREDLYLGLLLGRNVKISAYVPSQFIATDINMEDGSEVKNTVGIDKSFADNVLTLQTQGGVVSAAQALYVNKVVVTYKNK